VVFPGVKFYVIDPRGKLICCWPADWTHATRGHDDMFHAIDEVKRVLANPHAIYSDATKASRDVYYQFDVLFQGNRRTLKVAVEFGPMAGFMGGRLVTAYPVVDVTQESVKLGEHKVWA